MGLFDYITCDLPGVENFSYHTKDTPSQFLAKYWIDEKGMLWFENADVEDRSEVGLWKKDHPGEEVPEEITSKLSSMFGCMTRVNKRWEPCHFSGNIHMNHDEVSLIASFIHGRCQMVFRIPSNTSLAKLWPLDPP